MMCLQEHGLLRSWHPHIRHNIIESGCRVDHLSYLFRYDAQLRSHLLLHACNFRRRSQRDSLWNSFVSEQASRSGSSRSVSFSNSSDAQAKTTHRTGVLLVISPILPLFASSALFLAAAVCMKTLPFENDSSRT